jgi:hypothetical protein
VAGGGGGVKTTENKIHWPHYVVLTALTVAGGAEQRVLPRAEPGPTQPLREQDIQDRGPGLQGGIYYRPRTEENNCTEKLYS